MNCSHLGCATEPLLGSYLLLEISWTLYRLFKMTADANKDIFYHRVVTSGFNVLANIFILQHWKFDSVHLVVYVNKSW